jgi:hypothetical protein
MKSVMHTFVVGILAVATMAGSCFNAGAGESDFEMLIGYRSLSPTRDMDWERGAGIELQARFWHNGHIGVALIGASDTWDAKTSVSEMDGGSTYAYTAIAGDASITSLGASILYRSGSADDVRLVIDLGFRYATVNSAVYAEAAYDGPGGPSYSYEKIEVGNTLLFVAGAGLEFDIMKDVSLVVGFGYQMDMNKPEEKYLGESLGDTDLGAVTFGVGLSCRL